MKLYILSFPNGKIYIGISTNPHRRFYEHKKLSRKGSMFPVHCAIRKYDEHSVIQTIFMEDERDSIRFSEIVLIYLLETTDRRFGYNVTLGGDISPMHSESVRARVSATKKSRGASPAMLACSIRNIGRKATDEQRRNMSAAHIGKPWTEKQRAVVLMPGYKEKRSAIAKEVTSRPEVRLAMSLSQKGKKLSPEHYANVVAANRRVGMTPSKIKSLKAMHEGLRGKKRPEMGVLISSLRWITNGTQRRRVSPYTVLENGWRFGKNQEVVVPD